jgi:hypothetical protein
MVMEQFTRAIAAAESVTWMVTGKTPARDGTPVTFPAASMLRPFGSVPAEMLNVYGGVPADAPKAWV